MQGSRFAYHCYNQISMLKFSETLFTFINYQGDFYDWR